MAFLGLWTHVSNLCVYVCMVFPLCMCLCPNYPFYKDHSHIGLGAHLIQCDIILTNYICNDPYSKYSHNLRYQGLELQPMSLQGMEVGTTQPVTGRFQEAEIIEGK